MYHWREAARFALEPWRVFRRLPVEEQAGIIAHFETHNRMAALEAKERKKEWERNRAAQLAKQKQTRRSPGRRAARSPRRR